MYPPPLRFVVSVQSRDQHEPGFFRSERGGVVVSRDKTLGTKLCMFMRLEVRLHTAINRADFVSWCMLYIHEGNKMHS